MKKYIGLTATGKIIIINDNIDIVIGKIETIGIIDVIFLAEIIDIYIPLFDSKEKPIKLHDEKYGL